MAGLGQSRRGTLTRRRGRDAASKAASKAGRQAGLPGTTSFQFQRHRIHTSPFFQGPAGKLGPLPVYSIAHTRRARAGKKIGCDFRPLPPRTQRAYSLTSGASRIYNSNRLCISILWSCEFGARALKTSHPKGPPASRGQRGEDGPERGNRTAPQPESAPISNKTCSSHYAVYGQLAYKQKQKPRRASFI